MAKRIYISSIRKWAIGIGATSVPLALLLFWYLSSLGAITVTGFSGDQICSGMIDNPCVAYINMTAKEDIFIYPNENWSGGFYTNSSVKSVKMYRSWGTGWREINLTTNCKGTWCGASDSKGNTAYSFAFRNNTNYQLKFEVLKNNPSDSIKWGFGKDVDPYFYGVNNSYREYSKSSNEFLIKDKTFNKIILSTKLLKNTDQCTTNCETEGETILYTDGKLFDGKRFVGINGLVKQLSNSQFWIKVNENYSVNDYNTNCLVSENGTSEVCNQILIGNHSEERKVWKEYNYEKLTKGTYEWKLTGTKEATENVDFRLQTNGQELEEWQWWNGTGGTMTFDGLYTIETFTGNGTFVWEGDTQNISFLMVAGGGSGGYTTAGCGGGGGAGGVVYNGSANITAGAYLIKVGAGGTAGAGVETSGANSSFNFTTKQAGGGGFGAHYTAGGVVGANGGSGGGSGQNYAASGGLGIPSQGNDGGHPQGGGGGAV